MSSGNDLQEMEVGTTQSKTAVNAGVKLADPMVKPSGAAVEDLGGPTPENSKQMMTLIKSKNLVQPLSKLRTL